MTATQKGLLKTKMKAFPGTYVLKLVSTVKLTIQIGKRASLGLRPGYYLYVGSAFGPGGVRARVIRHSRGAVRRHWHIDYLLDDLDLEEVWYSYDIARREHDWAEVISSTKGYTIPLPYFGASDCHCKSHLFYSSRNPDVNGFRGRARLAIPDQGRIMVEQL